MMLASMLDRCRAEEIPAQECTPVFERQQQGAMHVSWTHVWFWSSCLWSNMQLGSRSSSLDMQCHKWAPVAGVGQRCSAACNLGDHLRLPKFAHDHSTRMGRARSDWVDPSGEVVRVAVISASMAACRVMGSSRMCRQICSPDTIWEGVGHGPHGNQFHCFLQRI